MAPAHSDRGWARALTREAIFDALWNRRVYATTHHRTWLKFSVNGHPMGSQINADGELAFEVEAVSHCPVVRLDLVREGQDAQALRPGQRDVCWRPREPRSSANPWYYVRAVLQDGQLAWSSPIWISVP